MDRSEKRRFKRLGAQYDISCRRIGSQSVWNGATVNICPGGVYFTMRADRYKRGDLLKIELSIPPKSGSLEFGGKMEGFAKVLRADTICNSSLGDNLSGDIYGVALQFCRPPKLCV